MDFLSRGTIAYKGDVDGFAITCLDFSELCKKLNDLKTDNYILVCDSTTPEYVSILSKFKGLIASQGGILSHTAIISRELQIPAIVGVSNILSKVKDYDYIFIKGEEVWIKQ